MKSGWTSPLAAAVAAATATPVCRRVARRCGVVDRPGPLKPQSEAVPYLGGVAVGAGLAAGTLTGGHASDLVAPGLAMALGLADDVTELTAPFRLAVELGIGVLTAARLPACPLWGRGLVAAANVVLINAVNLVDGLDGLAGGVVAAGALGLAALLEGSDRIQGLALSGALAGFLVFNWDPASIYLGDAGSYLLGAALARLVGTAWDPRRVETGLAAALAVGYPLVELGSSVVRRRRAGRPLMVGDRDHTYDRLVAAGWSARRVAAACGFTQAAMAVMAVRGRRLPRPRSVVVLSSAAGVVLAAAAKAGLFGDARSG